MHYYRMRRLGSYDLPNLELPETIKQSAGYLQKLAIGHPLQLGNRIRQYEHRIAYYDAHGKGPFQCHWCGKEITWATMDIDHLDENKENNQVSNLAASCPICNRLRGKQKMIDKNSLWIEWDGVKKTCKQWAEDIGISTSSMHRRLKKWNLDRAMTEPHGNTGPKPKLPPSTKLPRIANFTELPF